MFVKPKCMMIWFTYAVLLLIAIVNSQNHKTVFLTPSNTNTNGAYILKHINEVDTIDNAWKVDMKFQANWQFIVFLDDSFGFHPDIYSAIKFTINSPFITTEANNTTNNDLVFGFTTNNEQYLSMLIPIDNNGRTNKIYPSCHNHGIHPFNHAVGDISGLPRFDRICDIAGGSCTNWRDMIPTNIAFIQNDFPISILLENNPITNTLDLSLNTATFSTGFIQKCTFNAFPTDIGLKIYIAANNPPTQSFVINSFKIESWAETTTNSPTANPTNVPTKNPSATPTIFPSATPTIFPSKSPTDVPSNLPTNNPLHSPTNIPSNSPTKIPSNSPTNIPSNSPTNIPSNFPTKTPSNSPTNIPSASISPTLNPSNNPSISPTNNPTISPSDIPSISPTNNPSNNPTVSPTNIPSISPTPRPTDPGELVCPTQKSGAYNGGELIFEVELPNDGNLIFDATESNFVITQLKGFTNNVNNPGTPGNLLQSDDNNDDILRINDIKAGDYIFTIQGATNGLFDVTINCETHSPTNNPSNNPSKQPTNNPSNNPTVSPSKNPTASPTKTPTRNPTNNPSKQPTNSNHPTMSPSNNPSISPSNNPSKTPTNNPSTSPTNNPSDSPTNVPSNSPTKIPSGSPSNNPSNIPTNTPSKSPTNVPSKSPTKTPSKSPTKVPSNIPTNTPSKSPTNIPSNIPTNPPSKSPTNNPLRSPTKIPSGSPSNNPTISPSHIPSIPPSNIPTDIPTKLPSNNPSISPSNIPSISPTNNPTASPIDTPIVSPSNTPSFCCIANVIPNWNGRCWPATDAQSCSDVAPGNGLRCHWDPNNCRTEQNCLLRNEICTSSSQCCSEVCRADSGRCR